MAFHNIPPNGFPDLPDMEELEAVVKDVNNLSDNKANQITIAPFFNPEASYEVGDLVYYNGLSYRCTNDHDGEWDADDFAATTVSGELATLKNGLTNLNDLLLARVVFHGTLANDVLETAKLLDNNSVHFWMNSNQPSNHPLGCEWGSYIMYKMQGDTTILYIDREHFACTYDITSTITSITWHVN